MHNPVRCRKCIHNNIQTFPVDTDSGKDRYHHIAKFVLYHPTYNGSCRVCKLYVPRRPVDIHTCQHRNYHNCRQPDSVCLAEQNLCTLPIDRHMIQRHNHSMNVHPREALSKSSYADRSCRRYMIAHVSKEAKQLYRNCCLPHNNYHSTHNDREDRRYCILKKDCRSCWILHSNCL